MITGADPPAQQLFRLIRPGALVAQAIYVVAKLGVADRIDETPREVGDLAATTGSQAGPLRRTPRVLTSVGVLAEDDDAPEEKGAWS